MKTSLAAVLALVAGIGIGGLGVNSIHAQAKPPVYMIEDNTVRDPQGFAQEFAPLARESLKVHGGRYLGGGSGCRLTASRRRDVSSWFNGTRWSK
jgi:hypothetical protein